MKETTDLSFVSLNANVLIIVIIRDIEGYIGIVKTNEKPTGTRLLNVIQIMLLITRKITHRAHAHYQSNSWLIIHAGPQKESNSSGIYTHTLTA